MPPDGWAGGWRRRGSRRPVQAEHSAALLIQGVQASDEDHNAAHGQTVEDAPRIGRQRSQTPVLARWGVIPPPSLVIGLGVVSIIDNGCIIRVEAVMTRFRSPCAATRHPLTRQGK